MPEIDKDWIASQLQAAQVKVASGKAIMKLLDAWAEIPSLSDKMVDEVFSVFPKLARGHALDTEDTDAEYIWVELKPGNISVGDVVRVKHDSFSENLGHIHNGRVGKIIAVRYGDVIVDSTDGKTPDISGAHYSPYKLEKRVRKI